MGLELHFHGPLVAFDRDDGASERSAESRTAATSDAAGDSGGTAAPLFGAMVGLAVLVAVALAVKSRRGGDQSAPETDE